MEDVETLVETLYGYEAYHKAQEKKRREEEEEAEYAALEDQAAQDAW